MVWAYGVVIMARPPRRKGREGGYLSGARSNSCFVRADCCRFGEHYVLNLGERRSF